MERTKVIVRAVAAHPDDVEDFEVIDQIPLEDIQDIQTGVFGLPCYNHMQETYNEILPYTKISFKLGHFYVKDNIQAVIGLINKGIKRIRQDNSVDVYVDLRSSRIREF